VGAEQVAQPEAFVEEVRDVAQHSAATVRNMNDRSRVQRETDERRVPLKGSSIHYERARRVRTKGLVEQNRAEEVAYAIKEPKEP
jgi:hypothetical protein